MLVVCATALTVATGPSAAQTPAQMEYERQQREYWRQQEQQRQEQQRQQQTMQDNARRQQEESSRINAPSGGTSAGGAAGGARGKSADPGNAAAMDAARAMWQKRPALAPENNPLLAGRWMRPADPAKNSSDPFAGLAALMKGGMCEVLFGGGVFEFRRDALVGMDRSTPAQELDKVEYRGGGKHVVVLPKSTIKLIEFDFETPDRIHWAAQPNCVLVRVKSDSTRAATTAPDPVTRKAQ
jgi:hypothetical protein